jgi:hypothetical protein
MISSLMDAMRSSLGNKGGVLVTDATPLTGKWVALLALTDCTFTTLTTDVTKNGTSVLAVAVDWGTLSAGSVIYAKITEVTRLTGTFQLFV